MRFDPRANLEHDDPRFRGHASVMLKQSLDERDGDMLVRALIRESDGASFAWMCDVVMCKWMVKLESKLYAYESWPIADNCTVWFVIKAEGWEYPSYERFLRQHLDGDNWLYKFAAFLYCRQKLRCLGKVQQVCTELVAKLGDKSIDWEATAASANLKSKRRMRAKLERIAHEWELAAPNHFASATFSDADIGANANLQINDAASIASSAVSDPTGSSIRLGLHRYT